MKEEWVQIQTSTLQAGLDRVRSLEANLAAAQTRIAALEQALATCDGALEPFADLASHRVIDDALSFDKTHHGPAGLLISRGFGTAPISSGAFRAAREARAAAKEALG